MLGCRISYLTALIHGDVFVDNLVVQGDQLMAIVGTCRDRQGICFDKARQFIRGYQTNATIKSDERETLKIFTVYAAVATSFWRFRHYHLRRPEPQFFEKHVEMQTLANTISEYPNSSFTELFG